MADLGLRGERQVISIFRHHAPGATAALVGKAAHVTLVCRSRRELKKIESRNCELLHIFRTDSPANVPCAGDFRGPAV